MSSMPLAAWLQHRSLHYGGVAAAVTFCTMLTVVAALGLSGAMIQPLGREFGWIFAAHQIGAATAAWGAGLTRTLLLTYSPALYVAVAAGLLAAVFVIRRPARHGAAAAAAVPAAGRA